MGVSLTYRAGLWDIWGMPGVQLKVLALHASWLWLRRCEEAQPTKQSSVLADNWIAAPPQGSQ